MMITLILTALGILAAIGCIVIAYCLVKSSLNTKTCHMR